MKVVLGSSEEFGQIFILKRKIKINIENEETLQDPIQLEESLLLLLENRIIKEQIQTKKVKERKMQIEL